MKRTTITTLLSAALVASAPALAQHRGLRSVFNIVTP